MQISALLVQGVLSGEAIAGTTVSLLKIATKASLPYTEEGVLLNPDDCCDRMMKCACTERGLAVLDRTSGVFVPVLCASDRRCCVMYFCVLRHHSYVLGSSDNPRV